LAAQTIAPVPSGVSPAKVAPNRLRNLVFPVSDPHRETDHSMRAILDTILLALDMYWFVLIAAAVMSWLIAFNVVNTRNQLVASIWEFLYRITEPVLRPIRKILPDLGGLDISPIIVLLVIYFIERLIKTTMYPVGF